MYCWGCLLLLLLFFYKTNVCHNYFWCGHWRASWLMDCCVSELHAHLCPYIVMYGLRLFIVVLHELHCLPNCLHVCMIRVRCCYHFTKFRCSTLSGSEIAKCIAWGCFYLFTRTTLVTTMFVYYNVYCYYIVVRSLKSMCIPSLDIVYMAILYVPIIIYGLRVVLQELNCLLNCLHVCMIRVRGWYHITKSLHLLVSEIANVLPEAVYCGFTRTTLFTTMFTVMIVVFIEKYVYTSFVLIGCCVSELHGHVCPYLFPEAIYCCFTRTTLFSKLFTCLYDQSYHFTKFHCFTPSGFWDS